MHRREGRLFARELGVKVGRVSRVALGRQKQSSQRHRTYDSWEIRWWNPLMEDIVKVDVAEEGVTLDLLGIRFTRTKTASRVARQELKALVRTI